MAEELFDTFQRLRHPLLAWLALHSAHHPHHHPRSGALAVDTALHEDGGGGGGEAADEEMGAEVRRAMLARRWVTLDREGHAGRLLPDTELATIERALEKLGDAAVRGVPEGARAGHRH